MPAVSVVIIARDEERSIRRLIESVSRHVDEVVLIDTGSRDETAAIAKSLGAQVDYFEWQADFALARNYALSVASTPWRLVLDADEWLDGSTRSIRDICADDPTFVGRINIVSTFTAANAAMGIQRARTRVSRLLPTGASYVGAIHEQVVYSGPVRDIDITVYHDGYEDVQLELKGDRNFTMLKSLVDNGSEDLYVRYQYAIELATKNDHSMAAEILLKILLSPHSSHTPWHETAVCTALTCLAKLGRTEDGERLAHAETLRYSKSADFFYTLGFFYLEAAIQSVSKAASFLSLAEASWLRCLEIGEVKDKPHSVVGRGSFLATAALAKLYEASGQ